MLGNMISRSAIAIASALASLPACAQMSGALQYKPSAPPQFTRVEIDSLDTSGIFDPKPVKIHAYMLAAGNDKPGPAAVLNPACEGLLLNDGRVKPKYSRMAAFLHERGITALLIDGFNPRGYAEACSMQRIDHIGRLNDALGGLAYLKGVKTVDSSRILTVTWGNTGGFQGMNKDSAAVKKTGATFAGAVMFYPACNSSDRRFAPYAPILMFVGDKDAWNPAYHCKELAAGQEAGSASFDIKVYPDTYHSFDQTFGEPRVNPFNPKLGMVGLNADAANDAYRQVDAFLTRLFPALPERKLAAN